MEYYLITWTDISDVDTLHKFYLGGEFLGENVLFIFSYIVPLSFGLTIVDFEKIFPPELEDYLDFSLEPVLKEDIPVELLPIKFLGQPILYFYTKETEECS